MIEYINTLALFYKDRKTIFERFSTQIYSLQVKEEIDIE